MSFLHNNLGIADRHGVARIVAGPVRTEAGVVLGELTKSPASDNTNCGNMFKYISRAAHCFKDLGYKLLKPKEDLLLSFVCSLQ